ncbi:MAG: hypothetical protein ABR577_12140 [Pyrinomonadaceae bacterium]
MNDKLQPAIVGGVVLGILSAIPYLNTCCCLYALIGGALATYLYIKRAPSVSYADGALLGALAGAIGSLIYLVVGIPLGLMAGKASASMMTKIMESANPEQAEMFRQQIEAAQNQSFIERLPQALLVGILIAMLLTIFSTLGGLLAVPLFQSRKGGGTDIPPPPPSQNPGGGYGGYTSAAPPPQNYGDQRGGSPGV